MHIHLQNLSFFVNKKPIIQGLSADFEPNKLHYLVGSNGSGKSSLLKCLLKLQKYEGNICLNQQNLEALSVKQVAQAFAFVPQDTHLVFDVSVYDFLLTGRFPYLAAWQAYQPKDHERVVHYLEKFGLSAFAEQSMLTLSGGERQKAYLVRALIQDSPVLLLDEPAHSLDPKNKAWLYNLLAELVGEGKTVLCVSHDLEPLSQSDCRIWGMKAGKWAWTGKYEANLQEILWEKVYV